MKRRHLGTTLFALTWLIILLVPELRTLLRLQLSNDEVFRRVMPEWIVPWSRSPQELATQYPDDVRVQARAAMTGGSAESARKLLPVIQRFPWEAWLVADWLRFTTSSFRDDRIAGALENPTPGSPPPAKAAMKPSFTSAELKQMIEMAETGRRLEPDNCYFDMMLALFLFGGYQDEKALAVLHEGVRKPRYDDHVTDSTRFLIEARELEAPFTMEYKLAIQASALFPHYAKLRHLARLAVWEGIKAETAGNHQRALGIYADVARLGARMRDQRGSTLAVLVGIAFQTIGWSGTVRKLTPQQRALWRSGSDARARLRTLTAQRFAAYATQHKRAELAQETLRERRETARIQSLISNSASSLDIFLAGNTTRTIAIIMTLWWAGIALLSQLLLTAIVWLVLSILLWFKRVPGESPRSLLLASSVVVCGIATGLFGVAAGLAGAGWGEWLGWQSGSRFESLLPALRWLIAATPALLGALICAAVTWWRHRQALREATRYTPEKWAWTMATTWILVATVLTSWIGLLAWLAAGNTMRDLSELSLSLFLTDSNKAVETLLFNAATPLYFSFVCLTWWIVKSVWFTPREVRPVSGAALRWYGQTLGVFLVVCSLGYLASSLVSLGPRGEADAKMNVFLKQGEMGLLRQSTQD
ncbi:MAG: hypothetical protein M3347_19210 [Armatimonadota bacterium]|nr:hypothetical protein [Armatimonadota bacterium]